jgi:DNA-directed RNA polymerase specialized sigma subunit
MQYTNSEIAAIIAEKIHSERDRRIMSMIWIDGLTQERTAEIIDLTPRQIRNIIKKYSTFINPDYHM